MNIIYLQKEIKQRFLEQKYLFNINENPGIFMKRWGEWINIFTNI